MINVYKEELTFFEWLKNECNEGGKLPKVDVMSLRVFKEYVRRYCNCKSKGRYIERKIIKSFKGSEASEFSEYCEKLAINLDNEGGRDFKFISERYLSNGSIYKCLIFPRAKEYDVFKELVTEYYLDLDGLSANYLDIYFIFEDYSYSGSKLLGEFKTLDNRFFDRVPCIVIWKDSIDEAEAISIKGLSVEGVFDVIENIVFLIRRSTTLDQIVEGVDKKVSQLREAKSPVNNVVSKVNGNAVVNIINGSHNVVCIGNESNFDVDLFSREVNTALDRVDAAHELSDVQKRKLKSILAEADEGVKEKSQEKKTSSKSRFKTWLEITGQSISAMTNMFANLATILTFFGLNK